MPTVRDVVSSYPFRDSAEKMAAMWLDVKAVRKRVVIREEEQGLLGFTFADALCFYRVARFGATFAQHWWGRTASCILRVLHILIWFAHCGYLFVDDYLFSQLATRFAAHR